MDIEARLTDNYTCAKCRNKVARVRKIPLPSSGLREILREGFPPAYYAVTCSLCGYTEFYDSKVCAAETDFTVAPADLPQKS